MLRHFPDANITLLIDDLAKGPWRNYQHDLTQWITQNFPLVEFGYRAYSELDFQDCASGWWRAQLVKIYSDRFMQGDRWFLVDGDVIFDRVADFHRVTPYTRCILGIDSPVAVLHQNYVSRCLGITCNHLTVDGSYVATSPVPFRMIDRQFLGDLRAHVERLHGRDFLGLHLEWFRTQEIIAFEDPPQRMIMSEWELMECFRHYVQHDKYALMDMGSGYAIDKNTAQVPDTVVFRHSYRRDAQVDRAWFESQELAISDQLWQRAVTWYDWHRS